ncbi:MAG: hypothetical protein ACLRSW_15495 [Christensenellaceae bacterium]
MVTWCRWWCPRRRDYFRIKQGNVQRYADYDLLKSALRDYCGRIALSDKKNK